MHNVKLVPCCSCKAVLGPCKARPWGRSLHFVVSATMDKPALLVIMALPFATYVFFSVIKRVLLFGWRGSQNFNCLSMAGFLHNRVDALIREQLSLCLCLRPRVRLHLSFYRTCFGMIDSGCDADHPARYHDAYQSPWSARKSWNEQFVTCGARKPRTGEDIWSLTYILQNNALNICRVCKHAV